MSLKGVTKRYLLWYANEHISFRITEFESLASLFGMKYSYLESPPESPYLIIETSSLPQLLQIMKRTVLARSLFELWCDADCYDQFYHKLSICEMTQSPEYKNSDKSFRILIESFGKKLHTNTKVEKIEKLSFLPFEGPINLKNPNNSFNLFEYYGNDCNVIPEDPYRIMFGLWITDGHRKAISKLSLKQRKFIANTSMDSTLSLIMANIAKVNDGDLILDPFVGSGSLLVSAAYCGGYVFGTDIDYLLLNGMSKPTRFGVKNRDSDENILSNLKQYGLESKYIDVIVADAARPLWRNDNIKFDAIITDPPYGIRESRERIGTQKNYKIPEHLLSGHIPSKIQYNLKDIIRDLLNFSAINMKVGGRLVFWVPLRNENGQLSRETPSHICLKLISICEQQLSCYYSRMLIVMEKYREFNDSNYSDTPINENNHNNDITKQKCRNNSNKKDCET